jgi:hypothetical protein
VNVFRALGARKIVRRCPLFRISGVPILWLWKMREAITETATRTQSRKMIDEIDRVCRECVNYERCYMNPDLKGGRNELERVYVQARRLKQASRDRKVRG